MRTLTIKDADARRLVEMLAGKWAHRTTHLAGAEARIDNPLRTAAGPYATALKVESTRRAFEVERDWIGRVLSELGVKLPALNPESRIVVLNMDRGRQSGTTFNRPAAQAEAKRLMGAIVAQMKAEARP